LNEAADAWWRFAPAPPPDAAGLALAARRGSGELARSLRDARQRLGTARTVRLMQSVDRTRALRPIRVFFAASYQTRTVDDALVLAFAIAGLDVDLVAEEGLTPGKGAADAEAEAGFDCAIVSVAPSSGEGGASEEAALAAAGALATRFGCPVALIPGETRKVAAARGLPEGVTICPVMADLCGDDALFDTRFTGSLGTIPSQRGADAIADTAAGFAARIAGRAPKLLVTDLDETLWAGVLGETPAIRPRPRFGAALATLAERGLVIAAASRNDPAAVDAVLGDLAAEAALPQLAAVAVGWEDKPALVGEVLRKLGLAPGHTVFVDDDPVNCAGVAARYPDMDVRRFTGAEEDFAAMLLADPLLAATRPSEAAADRSAFYRRRAAVEAAREEAPDEAAFLERLGTRLTVVAITPAGVVRAAELARRVNQFALADFRPNEVALADRDSPFDFLVRLDDVFGSHGLVGLMLARRDGDAVFIDNLFLSCRALQRRVEFAMLAILAERARRAGASRMIGRVETLERNAPARGLFAAAGWQEMACGWVREIDLSAQGPAAPWPDGVTLDTNAGSKGTG
jgi:FkbH-like protein